MTDRIDDLEARMVAIELFIRSILASMVARSGDPLSEIERMADEFLSSARYLDVRGTGEDHAEKMLALIRARADENFDAIRGRIFREFEIEAAKAGKRN
jgi:hypothetical protein